MEILDVFIMEGTKEKKVIHIRAGRPFVSMKNPRFLSRVQLSRLCQYFYKATQKHNGSIFGHITLQCYVCVLIIYMLRCASSLSSCLIRDTVLLVCVVKVRIVFTICYFFSPNSFNVNLSFSLTLHTYTNLQDVLNSLIKSWLGTLILCCQ